MFDIIKVCKRILEVLFGVNEWISLYAWENFDTFDLTQIVQLFPKQLNNEAFNKYKHNLMNKVQFPQQW